jgi:hypothetical protein
MTTRRMSDRLDPMKQGNPGLSKGFEFHMKH